MKSSKLWFKAKRYGIGWRPVTMEGWVVTLMYLFLLVFFFGAIDSHSHSNSDTLISFSLPFIGLTSLFLSVCYARGECLVWHWGKRREDTILKEIKKAKRILLHCHPSPDPDSLGSTLAMKGALEYFGKKVTLIQGDSNIPPGFLHFPGADKIEHKSFHEVNLADFDLFIILDSGSPEMVSRKHTPTFPLSIRTIVIDHHASNTGYADINYIVSAPSTTFVLYKLFKEWGVPLTKEIASNLFIGLYTDTGGFKFPPTNHTTYSVAAELVEVAPNFIEIISKMENSQDKDSIYGQAIALNSIKTFHNDHLAISAVPFAALADKKISTNAISEGHIANIIKSVIGWDIAVSMVEIEPGRVKASFRSIKYDVSKLATALGGGGHKAAAGAVFTTSLDEAVVKVVETSKVLYNL